MLEFQDKLWVYSGEGDGKEIFYAEERIRVKSWSQEGACCSLQGKERVAKDGVDRQMGHMKGNENFKGNGETLKDRNRTASWSGTSDLKTSLEAWVGVAEREKSMTGQGD